MGDERPEPLTWNSEGKIVPLSEEEQARQAAAVEFSKPQPTHDSGYSPEGARRLTRLYKSSFSKGGQPWKWSLWDIKFGAIVLFAILIFLDSCARHL